MRVVEVMAVGKRAIGQRRHGRRHALGLPRHARIAPASPAQEGIEHRAGPIRIR
jgi:hypothetical protein